jgi:hypothetical protein
MIQRPCKGRHTWVDDPQSHYFVCAHCPIRISYLEVREAHRHHATHHDIDTRKQERDWYIKELES